jgi:hypothetical protein
VSRWSILHNVCNNLFIFNLVFIIV